MQRKLAGVVVGLVVSIVDGRERAMYRKSDLRRSATNPQILTTYTWTPPELGR